MKYIMDKYGNFALFSDMEEHAEVAKGFNHKPISAGICKIKVVAVKENLFEMVAECFGNSLILDLNSRKCDSKIITKYLNYDQY